MNNTGLNCMDLFLCIFLYNRKYFITTGFSVETVDVSSIYETCVENFCIWRVDYKFYVNIWLPRVSTPNPCDVQRSTEVPKILDF